jgi:glutaredoxin-like protein NrdH
MESRGFTFELINLDQHPEAVDDLREKGYRQLPVVVTDQESWSGFRPDMINRLHAQAHA